MGLIKFAAAQANRSLEKLDAKITGRIQQAAREVIANRSTELAGGDRERGAQDRQDDP